MHSRNYYRCELDALKRQLASAYEREAEYKATIARLSGEMIANPVSHLQPAEREKILRIRDAYQYNLLATLHDCDNLHNDIVDLCNAALAELQTREENARLTAEIEQVCK